MAGVSSPSVDLEYRSEFPGRLLNRQLEDAPLHRLGHPVLRVRHPARHLDQRRFAALLVQILKPVKAVAGKPHHPARPADAAELLRQLQHADLVADDLLVPRHRVVSSLRYSMSTLGDDTLTIAPCQIWSKRIHVLDVV